MPVQEEADVIKAREELKAALVARALAHEEFRTLLTTQPKRAVEQVIGGPLPDKVEVKVLEEPRGSFYVVLPRAAVTRPLSDAELSKVAGGAFNAFVNFGDIKGESTDKDHKDWVMLLSY
jgi:hypothetical protein